MKRFIFIYLSVLFFVFNSKSQNNHDRIETLRVAFISKRLQLTNSEQEKFWPVYNEYNDKIKAIRKNLRQNFRKNIPDMSEAEAEQLYALDLQSKQAETDVHKLYSIRLKQMIGTKKLLLLRVAEEDFKKEILKTLRESSE